MSKSRAGSATTAPRRSTARGARSPARPGRSNKTPRSKPSAGKKGSANVKETSVPPEPEPSKAATDARKPESRKFLPEVLDATVIAMPLLNWFKDKDKQGHCLRHRGGFLNLNYHGGLKGAREVVEQRIDDIIVARRAKGATTRMSRSVIDDDLEGEAVRVRLCDARRRPSRDSPAATASWGVRIAPSITSGRTFRSRP